jgi:hypothetical protein
MIMNARVLTFAVIVLALVAGVILLATRNVVPSQHIVEKVFSNDRFFK